MSHFLLQTGASGLELEEYLVEKELKSQRVLHDYQKTSLENVQSVAGNGLIPIGTIQFVTECLRPFGFDKMNPIEVPEYLRTEEFLKREHNIVPWDKIPSTGSFFLKDVSELKSFGSVVNTLYDSVHDWFTYEKKSPLDTTLVLDKSHLFQVSELFPVLSEYRVYVFQGEIEAVLNYNGDVTLFPDMELVKKAVRMINGNERWLKSYTIDVMVGNRGTAIIEVHNFASVGLYGTLWGNNLLYAYRDGIDYLKNDNRKRN